jgi:hypothetical protein
VKKAEAGAATSVRTSKLKTLERFVAGETENLSRLRDLLTGKNPAGVAKLDGLLDYCDYLWAHFPDCAGAGGRRPPGTDISFLKRVRTEIDPFLAVLNRTLAEIRRDAREDPV